MPNPCEHSRSKPSRSNASTENLLRLPHHQRRTDAHVARLLGERLLADAPRIDWARLLSRSLGIDVLTCDACGKPRRLLTAITDSQTARTILDHLDLASRPPPLTRARDRTEPQDDAPPCDDPS